MQGQFQRPFTSVREPKGSTNGLNRCSTPRKAPVRAAENQEVSTSEKEQQTARTTAANPDRLRLQKVERLGQEAWAGVAAVDRDSLAADTSPGKTALLVSGDFAALTLFMIIGKISHGQSLDIEAVLKSTAPFLIGWFGAADLQKAYGPAAQGGEVKAAALKAAQVWVVGIPVGIAVRSAQQGHLPSVPFSLVTLATTFVFLVGWRSVAAALTPSQGSNSTTGKKVSKKGNPFEFLQLLASLTKRW